MPPILRLLAFALCLVTCRVLPAQEGAPPTPQAPEAPAPVDDWVGKPVQERPAPNDLEGARALEARLVAVTQALDQQYEDADPKPESIAHVRRQLEATRGLIAVLQLAVDLPQAIAEMAAKVREHDAERDKAEKTPPPPQEGPVAEGELAEARRTLDEAKARLDEAVKDVAAAEKDVNDRQRHIAESEAELVKVRDTRIAAEQALAAEIAKGATAEALAPMRENVVALLLDEARRQRHIDFLKVSAESRRQARLQEARARQARHEAVVQERARLKDALDRRQQEAAAKAKQQKEVEQQSLQQQLEAASPARKPLIKTRLKLARFQAELLDAQKRLSEWETRTGEATRVGIAYDRAKSLHADVRRTLDPEQTDALPTSAGQLRRLLDESAARLGLVREFRQELILAEREARAEAIAAADEKSGLRGKLVELEQEARDAAGDAWLPREDEVWRDLRREVTTSADAWASARKALADELQEQERKIEEALAWDDASRSFLEHRLLWSREETLVSLDSIRLGLADARSIPAHLPGWVTAGVDEARAFFSDSGNWPRLGLAFGATLLAIVLLLSLVKRFARWAKATVDGPLRVMLQLLAAELRMSWFSLTMVIVLVGFPAAAGFASSFWSPMLVIAATPFVYRTLKVLLQLLFKPDDDGDRIVPIDDPFIAKALLRAGRWVLGVSAVFVPLLYLLRSIGYADRNTGLYQLFSLIYTFVAYIVILVTFFRPDVVKGLIRGGGFLARSAKAVLLVVYPLLVIGVAALFVLDALQYRVAAATYRSTLIWTALLLFVSYAAYRKLLMTAVSSRDVGRRISVDDYESEDQYMIAGRSLFFDHLIRLGCRLLIFVPVLMTLLWLWPTVPGAFLGAPLSGNPGGISLANILGAVIALFITVVVAGYYKSGMRFVIMPMTSLDSGLRYTITALSSYALIAIGIIVALVTLRVDPGSIAMVTSALMVGIGFGLQTIVRNLVSGLILLVERPVKVGDRVIVGSRSGRVEKITIRATTVMTWDGHGLVIPNETMIGDVLENQSLGQPRLRSKLAFGVAYGSDVDLVCKTVMEIIQAHPAVIKRPAPQVLFRNFGASSLDFEGYFWTFTEAPRPRIESELRQKIDAAFRKRGIEIPFNQLDLRVRAVDEEAAASLGGRGAHRPE